MTRHFLGHLIAWTLIVPAWVSNVWASRPPVTETFGFSLSDNVMLVTNHDADGQLVHLKVIADEASPLAIDGELSTRIIRGLEIETDLISPQHKFWPRKLLAVPNDSYVNTDTREIKNLGEWRREIPFALIENDYLRREWLWPEAGFPGVPFFVEYQDGSWGFVEIQLPKPEKRLPTQIYFHRFEGEKPASMNDMLVRVGQAESWPKSTRVVNLGLNATEFRELYLKESAHQAAELFSAMKKNHRHPNSLRAMVHLFRSEDIDFNELAEVFESLWRLSEKDLPRVSPHTSGFFVASHWAPVWLVGIAGQKNLAHLLTKHESEVLTIAEKAKAILPAEFYLRLYQISEPTRPTRFKALQWFLESPAIETPRGIKAYDEFQKIVRTQIENQPISFYSELTRETPSPALTRFVVQAYAASLTNTDASDLWTLSWMLKMLQDGRATPSIRTYIEHYRTQQPAIWQKALDHGADKTFFDCSLVIKKLSE